MPHAKTKQGRFGWFLLHRKKDGIGIEGYIAILAILSITIHLSYVTVAYSPRNRT